MVSYYFVEFSIKSYNCTLDAVGPISDDKIELMKRLINQPKLTQEKNQQTVKYEKPVATVSVVGQSFEDQREEDRGYSGRFSTVDKQRNPEYTREDRQRSNNDSLDRHHHRSRSRSRERQRSNNDSLDRHHHRSRSRSRERQRSNNDSLDRHHHRSRSRSRERKGQTVWEGLHIPEARAINRSTERRSDLGQAKQYYFTFN